MKKGKIVVVDFEPQVGAETMKTRPAVVISNTTLNNKLPVITVVPLRSNLNLALPFMHIIEMNKRNGLTKDSFADVCQLKSIDKRRVKETIGTLSNEDLAEVISSMMFVFDDVA